MLQVKNKSTEYTDGTKEYIFGIGGWFRFALSTFPDWDEIAIYIFQKLQIYICRSKQRLNNLLAAKLEICIDSFSILIMVLWFEFEISFDMDYYYDVQL